MTLGLGEVILVTNETGKDFELFIIFPHNGKYSEMVYCVLNVASKRLLYGFLLSFRL